MSNPNLGLPGRSAPGARGGCGWRVGILFVALLALLVCGIAIFFFTRGPTYTLPNVVIVEPPYGSELVTGQSVAVLSNARSADRITKQELWVDGLVVYVATTRDSQGQKEFVATLLWTPQAGQHTLVARALDARGNVGTSSVVRVNVVESTANRQSQSLLQVAQPGDTLDSIAKENGVTPDQLRQANPGVPDPPPPGEWVNIPPNNAQEGRNDDQPGGAVNDPGPVPLPPGADVGPANPSPGFGPPLLLGMTGLYPPTPPELVSVVPNNDCTATLTWRDKSNNESGFYIYRADLGSPDFHKVGPQPLGQNDVRAALTYTDTHVFGMRDYNVAAFNGAGEAASRIVRVMIPLCPQVGAVQMLEIEAESMSVSAQTEQAYCYIALEGQRPFERVPTEQSEYLHSTGQRGNSSDWNIAAHYGGGNKRVIPAPANGQPLRVEVECWGARVTNEGGEAFSLGSFDQSHPPSEWDGRALTGRGRSFTVVYHIRPWSGPVGAGHYISYDASIPAPRDFRQLLGNYECVRHSPGDAGSLLGCALMEYPSQSVRIWEWDGDLAQIDGFRIFENRTDIVRGVWTPLADVAKDFRIWFAPYQLPCGQTRYYRVAAYAQDRESAKSNAIMKAGKDCELVMAIVTMGLIRTFFFPLDTGKRELDDGCNYEFPFGCKDDTTMETYGAATFWTLDAPSGQRGNRQTLSLMGGGLVENALRGPGLASSTEHSTVNIRSAKDIEWANLPLCHVSQDGSSCEDGLSHGNNKMSFLMNLGDRLQGKVWLMDYDKMSGDDLWCDADFDFAAPSTPFDGTVSRGDEVDGSKGYGPCRVGVGVKFIRMTASRLVRPGESVRSPSSPLQADLEVRNVVRNSLGNLRVTLYNHGPDGVSADPVEMSYSVTSLARNDPGPPPPPTGFREQVLLTVPAYSQVAFDTGLPLPTNLEEFQVRVTVNTIGQLTDANANNNSGCWRFLGSASLPLPYERACR